MSDLSDFGGGAGDDPGPEHKAKHEITEWLESHGADVWWEEANAWGHDTFTIKRDAPTGGIPDLVVRISDEVFVIEFKAGESVGQLYDATMQLHGYWVEHLTTDQEYIADGDRLSIDGFLTASKHSRYGRLFPSYAEVLQEREDMSESRRSCYEYGQLPPQEYRMTEQHIRLMWRLVKRTEENLDINRDTPHIGSLLSSHLEREEFDPYPAVLWNRGRTNQDWVVFRQ